MANVGSFDGASAAGALSRRSAVLRIGGGGLAMLLASSTSLASAQEATPEARGRAYLAIRRYQLAPGRTMDELSTLVESGFLPILRQVPGFQEYFLVETDEDVHAISMFADQAGAEESTRRAADWIKQNLADFFTGPPTVTIGSVWLHDFGGAVSGTPEP